MKSKAKGLAIFTAGLLVGAFAMLLVMGKINQRQVAEHYAMSVSRDKVARYYLQQTIDRL